MTRNRNLNSFFVRSAVPVVLLLCTSRLAWPGAAPVAWAEISPCRSDPVVVLSNGITLDLSADISDSDSDVQQVGYTLNVPADVTVVSTIQSDTVLGLKESFSVVSGNPAGTYSVSTRVLTGNSGVAVTATTVAISSAVALQSDTASGRDQQTLQQRVQLPADS